MKVVLFCGGFGMRMGQFSQNSVDFSKNIPKPMVQIGNRPIIWHIMKYYAHFGHKDFILCLGYKSEKFRKYFEDNDGHFSDWNICLVDTGLHANIGQRLLAVRKYLKNDDVFMANYTDALSDVNIDTYLDFFIQQNKVGSLLSMRAPLGFHRITSRKNGIVKRISYGLGNYDLRINAGFFIFKKKIFDFIQDGEELVEEPFQRLIREGELVAYEYEGFWRNIDNYKDKIEIDNMHDKNNAPWIIWNK